MKEPKRASFVLKGLGYFAIATLALIGGQHLLYQTSRHFGFTWPPDSDLSRDWTSVVALGIIVWFEMRRQRRRKED